MGLASAAAAGAAAAVGSGPARKVGLDELFAAKPQVPSSATAAGAELEGLQGRSGGLGGVKASSDAKERLERRALLSGRRIDERQAVTNPKADKVSPADNCLRP